MTSCGCRRRRVLHGPVVQLLDAGAYERYEARDDIIAGRHLEQAELGPRERHEGLEDLDPQSVEGDPVDVPARRVHELQRDGLDDMDGGEVGRLAGWRRADALGKDGGAEESQHDYVVLDGMLWA